MALARPACKIAIAALLTTLLLTTSGLSPEPRDVHGLVLEMVALEPRGAGARPGAVRSEQPASAGASIDPSGRKASPWYESLPTGPGAEREDAFTISAIDLNATRFATFGYADVGNEVRFISSSSVPDPEWFIDNASFSTEAEPSTAFGEPGTYWVQLRSGGLVANLSEIVNPSIEPTILLSSTTVETGVSFLLSANVIGGTVLPNWSYTWSWFLNGVYQSQIGDRDWQVPTWVNTTGSPELMVTVSDALGLNGSAVVTLTSEGPLEFTLWEYWIDGAILYGALVALFVGRVGWAVRRHARRPPAAVQIAPNAAQQVSDSGESRGPP